MTHPPLIGGARSRRVTGLISPVVFHPPLPIRLLSSLSQRERERAGLRTAESRLAMARAQIAFRPKDSRLSLLENAFFSGCTVKQSRGNPRTADEALLPSAISS